MPQRNSTVEHIIAKTMNSVYADARQIGHTASEAIDFAQSAKQFIVALHDGVFVPERVGSGMRKIVNIVRHKGVRHEMTDRQMLALRAIIGGYYHIDRRDGLSLLALGFAFHTPRGFQPTRAGKEYAGDEFYDIGIPV